MINFVENFILYKVIRQDFTDYSFQCAFPSIIHFDASSNDSKNLPAVKNLAKQVLRDVQNTVGISTMETFPLTRSSRLKRGQVNENGELLVFVR